MARVLVLFVMLAAAGCDRTPSVSVDGELLLGKREHGVHAFFGVPFAEPPLGALRWRAPQPLVTKLERRDASAFAPACMQTMRILDWYRYMAETFGGSRDYYADLDISEDCLYLNIWTPSLEPDAALPVMVWVHGGSNKSGWSYEDNYHGDVLARQGVVVISVAYRHGAFGFLSHPEMAGQQAVANFGLWDLVAALEWIRAHVARFGGDPARVTLFGESSGAENILALALSPRAQPLFRRAILQSTARFGLDIASLDAERRRGSELARLAGAGSLAELREIDAAQLLELYSEHFDAHFHSPVIDGHLLVDSTWAAIESQRFADHELIIGSNADEWLDSIDRDLTSDDLVARARDLSRIGGEAALAVVADEPDPRRALDRLTTAEGLLCPSQGVAARRSASGGAAWMYRFSRVREGPAGESLGAYHGAEIPYVFGIHDAYMPATALDRELTATMQRYWLNFAATGNPNAATVPDWPVFERPHAPVLELGDSVRTIAAPEPALCAAFEASLQEP